MKELKCIDGVETTVGRLSPPFSRVTITPEAVLDYEHCLFSGNYPSWDECLEIAGGDMRQAFAYAKRFEKPMAKLDQRVMKADLEEYIDIQTRSGRLLGENRIRHKYLDESSGRMLTLFLRLDKQLEMVQNWSLIGICFVEDYDNADSGAIDTWLEQEIAGTDCDSDCVVKARVDEIIKTTGEAQYVRALKKIRQVFRYGKDKADAENAWLQQCCRLKQKRGYNKKNGQSGCVSTENLPSRLL